MADDPICSAISSVESFVKNVLTGYLLKRLQLQRLAAMLEAFGSAIKLPNISALTPILNIDQAAYALLRSICPELNLPPYSNQELAKLRATVLAAYSQLAALIANHPWTQLAGLEAILAEYLGKAEAELLQVAGLTGGILGCITKLCASGGLAQLGGGIANLVGDAAAAPISAVSGVLTNTQKGMVQYAANVQTDLTTLASGQGLPSLNKTSVH